MEVLGKALGPYVTIAKAHGIDPRELLAEFDLNPAQLPEHITWATFGMVTERLAARIPLDAIAAGMYAEQKSLFAALKFFAQPNFLLRAAFDWRGNSLFPCHTTKLTQVGPDRYLLRVEVQAGLRPCRTFFDLSRELIKQLPTLVGAPPAVVEMTASELVGEFQITLPRSTTLLSRLSGSIKALGNSRHVIEELTSQIDQLNAKHWALVHARAEADAARERAETARDVAERALAVKGEFLATVTHEIRTPINGIVGMLSLLQSTPLNATQTEYIDMLTQSADHLVDLINNILDFSKLESVKLDLEEVDFDLSSTTRDVIESLIAVASDKGVNITLDVAPDVPNRVCADRARLRQVLTNVIGNAVKFTQQGRVDVRISVDPAFPSGGVKIEVEDTGIGIAASSLAHIFDSFTQAHQSIAKTFGGSGLGLAICRQLVTLLGGSLTVKSQLGVGSCFTISIPVASAENEEPTENANTALPLSGRRFLAIDDNRINLRVISDLLSGWGAACVTASTAKEALLLAGETDAFDAILLDQRMPDAEGTVLAKTLHARIPDTALVLLSSDIRVGLDNVVESGVSAVVHKPIRPARLLRRLRSVLTGHESVRVRVSQAVPETRARILVVDDHPINLKVLTQLVGALGYEPLSASDGQQAIDIFNREHVDLILVDCQMPVKDGYAATIELRNGGHKVPIVAITANTHPHDLERCINAGMNDALTKPVRRPDIAACIERWLPRSAAE